MALIINNNLEARKALNQLTKNENSLGRDLKAASSGQKINSASDGASEFAISRRLAIEERGLAQDIDNVKTGRNLLATAEGGIQEVINNLRDMRKMAINAANDTNTDADRATIEKEFSHRQETIIDIAATTNYNGKLLLAGDYHAPHSRWETVTSYTASTLTVTQGPPSVSYVPGTNGVITVVQDNSVSSMVSAFSAGTGATAVQNVQCYDTARTVCPTGFKGNPMMVKVDFSGATANGSSAGISDFNGQGFSILCGGCSQYINITFDDSIAPSASTRVNSSLGSGIVNYTIGISGITSVSDLPAALFTGLSSVNGTTNGGQTTQVHSWHNLNMTTDGTNYYFTKSGPSMGLYDEGTILAQTKDPSITPGTVTITNPTTQTYTTWTANSHEELVEHTGKPLVIHDTTVASNALHVYINSMHPRAITGHVPMRDPITWELIAQKDPRTGEVLKDADGNPIPAGYKEPDPTLEDAHVRTRREALEALDIIDMALDYALNEITNLGAYQMRLDHDENKLTVQNENTTASMSTIQDADMAATITNYTKHNVLTQSAQLMLAQANQNSSRVLSLLQ